MAEAYTQTPGRLVYKTSLRWPLFLLPIPLFGVVAGVSGAVLWFFAPVPINVEGLWISLEIAGGSMTCVLLLLALRTPRLILDAEGVQVRDLWRRGQLRTDEILGYRLDHTDTPHLIFVPRDMGRHALKTPMNFKTDERFWQWMSTLDHLGQPHAQPGEATGATRAHGQMEQAAQAARARWNIRALNAMSWAACFWSFYLPPPGQPMYLLITGALMLLPWFAAQTTRRSKAWIRLGFDGPRKSPNITYCITASVLGLCNRAASDFDFLNGPRLALVAAIIGGALCWAAYRADATLKSRPLALVVITLLSAGYGFGAALETNFLLDRSRAEVYAVLVLDKHTAGLDSGEYYLDLEPWGPFAVNNPVAVRRWRYNETEPGDSVCMRLKRGLYSIPYFGIVDCR